MVELAHLSDQFGQIVTVQPFNEPPDMVYALAHYDAMFSKMAEKRVYQVRPLSDEQLIHPIRNGGETKWNITGLSGWTSKRHRLELP